MCSRPLIDSLQAPIVWDPVDVTPELKDGKAVIPEKAIESVRKNLIALKGPLAVCYILFPTTLMKLN